MNSDRTQKIINVISGQAVGWRAQVMRSGLALLEPVYRTIAHSRNRSYDLQKRVQRVTVPVLSIGNLTTGGTGKTPLVGWLISQLQNRGQKPAIVSRGYGSQAGQPNDEYQELKLLHPDTVHIQNADRVMAAEQAIQESAATSIVLDDGFQHRRIARDLDIVLIDATCPFGFDHLLPRGLLREPIASLSRADVVIVTRVDQVTPEQLQQIRNRLTDHIDESSIALVSFACQGWVSLAGKTPIVKTDDRVVGFCGIGNPAAFQQSLHDQHLNVAQFVRFADHYRYTQSDLDRLEQTAQQAGATKLVCTMKDMVKLKQLDCRQLDIVALQIGPSFVQGESMLLNQIDKVLGTPKS